MIIPNDFEDPSIRRVGALKDAAYFIPEGRKQLPEKYRLSGQKLSSSFEIS